MNWFTIHPHSGLITTSTADENNRNLDREIQETFELKVTAEDGGAKPKTATTTITIQLTDVNDNAPKFSKSEYSVDVSEDTPTHQPFFSSALATDLDKGENGTVSYYLTGNDAGKCHRNQM